MKKYIIAALLSSLCIVAFLLNSSASKSVSVDYPKDRLYVPTQVTKLNGLYFIVDCFQHRVIYNENLSDNIENWNNIDYEFAGPHSIATDGQIYVVDNAGRNEILVFNSDFKLIQTIKNIEGRPHKTIYNNDRFYVLTSEGQKIYVYQKTNGLLVQEYSRPLPFLDNAYVRSMKIVDGKMYFVSSNNQIFSTEYLDGSFSVVESHSVPESFYGLIDVEKFGGEFYLTSMGNESTIRPQMVKTSSLADLSDGKYQSIYSQLNLKDKPYFMTLLDDRMYFTEVGESRNSVISIGSDMNQTIYYRFEGLDDKSAERRDSLPR